MASNFIHKEYKEMNHRGGVIDFSQAGYCCGKMREQEQVYDPKSQRLVELTHCKVCNRIAIYEFTCH